MRFIPMTTCLITSLSFAGCSIHPVPKNFSGVETTEIVERIRCESYDAIEEQITRMFEMSNDPRAKAAGRRLREDVTEPVEEEHNKVYLEDKFRKRLRAFKNTQIGYAYQLQMEEFNEAAGTGKFTLPLSNGIFTLGFDAGKQKTRKNTREFYIVEKFDELMKNPDNVKHCAKYNINTNYMYPITGSIGMHEIVNTFTKISATGNKLVNSEKYGAFADTLVFTTQLTGGVNPVVTLNPVSKSFQLTNVGIDINNRRTDTHQVQIIFTLPQEFDAPGLARATRQLDNRRALDAVRNSTTPFFGLP